MVLGWPIVAIVALAVVLVIVVMLARDVSPRALMHWQGRLPLGKASCAGKAVQMGACSLVHKEQMVADASSRRFEESKKGSCRVWDFD